MATIQLGEPKLGDTRDMALRAKLGVKVQGDGGENVGNFFQNKPFESLVKYICITKP